MELYSGHEIIYQVTESWKKNSLLNDYGLIWENETIWTKENLYRFRKIFIDSPDESGKSFDEKLKIQLEHEDEKIYKLVIEILFIYYLFPYPGSITYQTKMNKLKVIASWKDIFIDDSLPVFEAFRPGLGATGTTFNTGKYFEISLIALFVSQLKESSINRRKEILERPQELKQTVEIARNVIGRRVQMQHILLHILLPNYFERIASWRNKGQIVKSFETLLDDDTVTDTDEQLYIIRETLKKQYPNEEINFYDNPNLAKQWQKQQSNKKEEKVSESDKEVEEKKVNNEAGVGTIPSINFDIQPGEHKLVFENYDILIEQITSAIRSGKHIILTGPPGTGKSKLAKEICKLYQVDSMMATAASNWSTYETIGGYRPNQEGNLYFDEGIFLECVKDKQTNEPKNKWLIIDEINRADIDKAFGSLFSVLTGDEVSLPFQTKSGETIRIKPQGNDDTVELDDFTYIIPSDWRIIGTMNTIDKASLYEMSYAFMRRFAFIPVGIPKDINNEIVEQYLHAWGMDTYSDVQALTKIWEIINDYRKIGPAIIKDIANYTSITDDYASAIILYVLPQFEGLSTRQIKEFVARVSNETVTIINRSMLDDFVDDFFHIGEFE